ncbi:hypothetical protein Pth03_61440 [Planotetraspora thailandica]|uniref:Prenyltransferase n=1 Tax=Planotetraspora thailandica TaxID=487172 RepID=A0A8J3XYQ8_9ACTN|nr:hypothetical protein [Planotetraspora thailandica]GII57755.1 hypothetical protein Pth03_61440 [Planotetraspora thailandica]
MSIDLSAAAAFMATHARLLDRRRFAFLTGEGDVAATLNALDGYRNPDGGYGWGLEPDLRSPESQPAGALHAFEVFDEIGPAAAGRAAGLCDWLESVSFPDGGVPFALPTRDGAGNAPWWAGADTTVSSLQITAAVAAGAHRVAVQDPAVAAHPWLGRATAYCLAGIAALDEAPHAYTLLFVARFLDAVHATHPQAEDLLGHVGAYFPSDGLLPVEGGAEGETLRPLGVAPYPGTPARKLFTPEAVSADLDRLAGSQAGDGGWTIDFAPISPAAAMEWRGYTTVSAIDLLRRNGRI